MKKSRKKRGIRKGTPRETSAALDPSAELERCIDHLAHLLDGPATYDSYDWLLLARWAVDAERLLMEASRVDPSLPPRRFDAVLEELREATSNFTNGEFLQASRAARRENPALFTPRR